MSSKNYDIDNILKEVDDLRTEDAEEMTDQYNGSVTDIINHNDLDKLLHAGSQKKKTKAGKQKPDLSVTQLINQYSDKRDNVSARQLTESETDLRRSEEISEAIEAERRKRLFDDELKFVPNGYNQKLTFDTNTLVMNGETGKNNAFDQNDDTSESEFVKPFTKPDVAGENDDIIFHTRGDLVTTETMQMRKQQRINEINQALLKADSEAQSPDEMLDLLNPAAKREKVADMLRLDDETTDTLAIAGNDLKKIGKEDHVIEYKPSTRRRDSAADTPAPAGRQMSELHIGNSINDALEKKIANENEQKSYTIKTPENMEYPTGETGLEKPDSIPEQTDEDEELERIRTANELAQKRKRRIANFILENPSEEEDEFRSETSYNGDTKQHDTEEEETIDLDDENIIRERLNRSAKGLFWRLIITGVLFIVTLIIGILNISSNNQNLGPLGTVINMQSYSENYLYCMLTIGVLSFGSCSSVISNGFSRLFRLRPDGDTLCAVAHIAAIVSIIPHLMRYEYIQRSMSHVYLVVSLALLCCNTLSKFIAVKTAQRNFAFVSADGAKYFAETCDKGSAEQLSKGSVSGVPVTAAMRKTEMLKDFIISTYCEDASDRISGKTAVATLIAAVIAGVIAFFTNGDATFWQNNFSWAFTVFSAVCCLGAAMSCSMTVTIPLLLASIKGRKEKFAILGYEAVENFSDTNSVLVEASALFPPSNVVIDNICGYDKPSNRGDGKVNIDEAIILGASLAYASGSILSDALFNMLDYKPELLKSVNGTVYESNLGVMGWIDRRRVLLGTREHMMAHEISVPSIKKETAANPKHDNVIYLAVGGEVCLLFFVSVTADKKIKAEVQRLVSEDVTMIVKTVDGIITGSSIANIFEIPEDLVKVIPFENHDDFNECTKFISSGNAGLSLGGTFSSFAEGISAAKKLREKIHIGSIVQICTVALGILLAVIFMLFKQYSMFNGLWILLYGVISAVITVAVPFIKRL